MADRLHSTPGKRALRCQPLIGHARQTKLGAELSTKLLVEPVPAIQNSDGHP